MVPADVSRSSDVTAVLDAMIRVALGRVGMPRDVADAAIWLCADAVRFVTGQSLLVEGGLNIPGPR